MLVKYSSRGGSHSVDPDELLLDFRVWLVIAGEACYEVQKVTLKKLCGWCLLIDVLAFPLVSSRRPSGSLANITNTPSSPDRAQVQLSHRYHGVRLG